jgi:tRNA(Ile)-lysidine synthase
MLKLSAKLPRQVVVAFSGGVDSTAVLDFLSRSHDVTAAFFHHNTVNSERAFEFVSQYCFDRKIPLMVGMLNTGKPSKLSWEEFWREQRYSFFDSLGSGLGPIVTAHNLDDCVETYLFSALHGTPKVIPVRRSNVIRPFLTTEKKEFYNWCKRKNVPWCEDDSNTDTSYMRNYIRHELMPHAIKVNPGLHKVVRRIVQNQYTCNSI